MSDNTPTETKVEEVATPTETTVSATTPVEAPVQATKISNIKRAFLYVLVGGLVVSAIISISAILVGEFNSVISKSLLTTLVFMTHSLLVLGIILADKDNTVGRALVPTVILGSVIASMLTSSLGIWQVWDADYSWRAIMLYSLLIGAAFLYVWTRQARINHTITKIAVNTALVTIALLVVALSIWIIAPESVIGESPYLYRAIGAISILGITSLAVAAIFNRVAVTQKPELAATAPAGEKYRGSMLAIVITVGSIVAMFWFVGLFGLIASGVSAESAIRKEERADRFEQRYNDDRYDRFYRD